MYMSTYNSASVYNLQVGFSVRSKKLDDNEVIIDLVIHF